MGNINWETILVSLLSNISIIAIIAFFLKVILTKYVEVLAESIKEKNKSKIGFKIKKDSLLYDEQLNAIKIASSLSYRGRNQLRNIFTSIKSSRSYENISSNKNRLEKVYNTFITLEDLLFDAKLFLPSEIFDIMHEIKNRLYESSIIIKNYLEYFDLDELSDDKIDELEKELELNYISINSLHDKFISLSKSFINDEA